MNIRPSHLDSKPTRSYSFWGGAQKHRSLRDPVDSTDLFALAQIEQLSLG